MFTSIVLAFVLALVPPTEVASNPKSAESLQVSIGDMMISGKSIQLTSGQSNQADSIAPVFKCAIDGDAQFTLRSKPDIKFLAQNMVISSDGNSKVSISCNGSVKCVGTKNNFSADRIQIQLAQKVKIEFSGNVMFQTVNGDRRMSFSSGSMVFHDAKFLVKGTEAINLGE